MNSLKAKQYYDGRGTYPFTSNVRFTGNLRILYMTLFIDKNSFNQYIVYFHFFTHPPHNLKLAADIFNNMHKEVGKTVSVLNICAIFPKKRHFLT